MYSRVERGSISASTPLELSSCGPQGTTKNIDIASVDKRLHEVRGLHERLMQQLTNVQDKTAVILKGTLHRAPVVVSVRDFLPIGSMISQGMNPIHMHVCASNHAEQEKDLLKAFRARLAEVNAELKKESMRADRGAQEWMDKCALQARELVRLKGIADTMTMENATVRDIGRFQPGARVLRLSTS